jgi:hypothetical protein
LHFVNLFLNKLNNTDEKPSIMVLYISEYVFLILLLMKSEEAWSSAYDTRPITVILEYFIFIYFLTDRDNQVKNVR